MPTTASAELCITNNLPPSPESIEDNLPLILEKLGIKACVTSSGKVITPVGGSSTNSSVGCESIEVISKSYLEAKTAISCIVNKVSTCSQQTIKITQSIEVDNRGTIDCTCPPGANCAKYGLNISNFANANMVARTQFGAQINNLIGETTTEFLEKLFETTLNEGPDLDSGPVDGKRVEQIQQELRVFISNINWNEVVQQATSEIFINGKITLVNSGIIRGSSCSLRNESVAELVSDIVIMSALNGALAQPAMSSYLKDLRESDPIDSPEAVTFSTMEILGIVIGTLVGVLLLSGCIYAFTKKTLKKK